MSENPFEESLLVSLNIKGHINKHATLKDKAKHLKGFHRKDLEEIKMIVLDTRRNFDRIDICLAERHF